ncbi:transmembrane protein 132C isoform X1 [Cylas formicarius]|uniref:transmembrane protein 132C isoform X1 n=1 Tax=Cylas formicarius TaxID=197179 RepID=UPI002958D380|nr:transmembrane protein 132C isoform X1 [Cylas formicarius]
MKGAIESIVLVWIFWFVFGSSLCVNVHFENKDGGFFLKQQPRQHYSGSALGPSTIIDLPPSTSTGVSSTGQPLSIDRFTVFQSSQPISVRATYGPFSTKQTVPARYVVPDPMPMNTSGPVIDLQDQAIHHLDMSAHIVRNEVSRDSPILRVLFHTGTDPGGRRQMLLARHHQRVCIILHASMGTNAPLHAACSPGGEDGVCLAQVTVPASWWPPLPTPDKDGRPGKPTKTPPRLVQVAYSVLEPWPDEGEGCHPKMQVQPSVILGMVPLVPAKGAYKELKLLDALTMLVPHPPLFPMSRLHVSVFVDRLKAKSLTAVVIRARVKSGVRLLEVSPSSAAFWNVTSEINPRHTGATVTLVRKEVPDPDIVAADGEVVELFTWLLEITEDATESYDGARIVWNVRYEPHQGDTELEIHRSEGRKSSTRFEIQKDDIQAVVPISKNWEVLNTAVLTGQQVSQAMKIFIVSQAGKAADVTFQASCHSEDDNVLKVSSSCGSVYVDGSEQRGSVNGSVLVKYGTYTGLAKFTVWMPEFPLELSVADTKLSQVKSWRVPDYNPTVTKSKRRRKRSYNPWSNDMDMGNVVEKPICRLRYQQTSVDVYAHFMATDHDSGRVNYLINRRTWLRITDLVLPWLRVSDPRIASLHGRVLQGRSVGRTEVQVLSPITSRVFGSKEIRVGNDKVSLSKMSVQVVSGLQLNISPDSSIENGYVAETSVTRKLTAQYQEGLLDIELEFSDSTKTALRDISDMDYHLVVESLDPEVVAFAPMVASHHPRVIAVGEGSGDLLQVTLLLSEECRTSGRPKTKSAGPLATAAAHIAVDFTSDLAHRPDILQNDGGSYNGGKSGRDRDFSDLHDILKDDEPNVQARQYQGNKGVYRNKHHNAELKPLEISMYVLLAAFCCAIVVFVVSCVVYASKFKPIEQGVTAGIHPSPVNPTNLVIHREPRKPRESTQNAHDWVWLGRATMDTTSNRNSTVVSNNNGTDIRIITNPLNTNYCDPDDCLATSFSNPSHIDLPSRSEGNMADVNSNQAIDSRTYCRSKGTSRVVEECNGDELVGWNKPIPPPPLPPHAVPLQMPSERVISSPKPDDEYRPPVPPHRVAAGSESQSPVITPKKHHHHHHQRSGSRSGDKLLKEALENSGRPGSGLREKLLDNVENREMHVFKFDDEPVEQPKKDEKTEFVQYPKSPSAKSNRNSAEVKRATIVGNPMFSADERTAEMCANTADLPGLDDLQLDMDYDQIMHYFENLKESNA